MTQPANPAGGSILTRKTGPLPNWVWMTVVLLVAIVYSVWQRNKAAATAAAETTETTETLTNQTPPPVFILPQNPQPTVPININVPAGPGYGTNPPAPPIGGRPPTVVPAPVKPPAPPPKPTPPKYVPVPVVKYTSTNPPWNSTMWGIAKHLGYGAAGNNYLAIWNDPKNAALKAKRKDPKYIHAGDIVYVQDKR